MAPRIVMAIRHAEKPTDGTLGVNENGENDPKSLTPRGWQRAGALVALLGAPKPRKPFARPTHIVAAGADDEGPSNRPLETVSPLAQKLGLAVQSPFDKSQLDDALEAALALGDDDVVLLAWEHKTLAAYLSAGLLASGVRIDGDVPAHWPGDRFDLVWVFTRSSPNLYRFSSEAQSLLSGDEVAS